MRALLLRSATGLLVAASLSLAAEARGDWPTGRHDAKRTGATDAPSNIVTPAAYWRAYLGAAVGTGNIADGDVDGDGSEDVLVNAGGSLQLLRPSGAAIWKTAFINIQSIDAIVDVDGDGTLDVVAHTPSYALIVDGASGAIEWQESAGEIGTIGAVRVGDVDGDGLPEVWVDTCGCCALETGAAGFIYTFAQGFANPGQLSPPPARAHCGAASDTIGDFDGDGVPDLMLTDGHAATMVRSDGSVLGTSASLSSGSANQARCVALKIGNAKADSALCFENDNFQSSSATRAMYLVAYDPALMPPVHVVWTKVLSDSMGDAAAPVDLAVDLVGDGTLEAIASGKTNGAYTTYVVDASTGQDLASIPGQTAIGTIASTNGPGKLLLTYDSNNVSAYVYGASPPAFSSAWQVADRSVPTQVDWSKLQEGGFTSELVLRDLDGDGRPELLLQSLSEPTVVAAYDTSKSLPAPFAQYTVDAGVTLAALGTPFNLQGAASSAFVSRNDGYVALLNNQLVTTNVGHEGTDVLPGLRVQGFLQQGVAPVVAKLKPSDAASAVLIVDSRGDTIRLDATNATNVAPAKPSWRLADSHGAGILPASGATLATIGIFRRRHPLTDPPTNVLASVDADGQEIGAAPLSMPGFYDVLPGSFEGPGSTGFVALETQSFTANLVAMNAQGTTLWTSSVPETAGLEPMAVADWDGDGTDDVGVVASHALIYSGHDGGMLAQGAGSYAYFMPIFSSLGDPQLDVVLQGGYSPQQALAHDLNTVLWSSSDADLPYPYGSIAKCVDHYVLIEGSLAHPSRLSVVTASGAGAGAATTFVLASGSSYPDEATATAAGATLGQLGAVAVSSNLNGSPNAPTALVGSGDGYLYAVDPCKAALTWSLPFGAPVSDPVIADADGDGLDEILVAAGDGYLHALKQQILPAPGFVWDVDPPHNITDHDVDQIQTENTLYAKWGPVEGAMSYEVAVVDQTGAYITSPDWIDVGDTTQTAIPSLSLTDGAEYFVGVRAVDSAGKGPDAPSNGVVVNLGSGGAGGGATGSGGAASSVSSASSTSIASSGAGGAPRRPQDILLTGRACTCELDSNSHASPWMLALLAFGASALRRGAAGRRRSSAR